MRAIVTGGLGFIGSHLADALRARGDEVMVLDVRYGEPTTDARFEWLNVYDPQCKHLIREWGADVVFHYAAQSSVAASCAAPVTGSMANVVGTVRVIEGCVAAGARLVFASTGGAMYRHPYQATEWDEAAPVSPYGASKLAAEAYIRSYARAGLRATVLRYANVYGPRQRHDGESGIVAIAYDRKRRGVPVTVYGDGRATRDFLWVGDAVDAALWVADRGIDGLYNVGTGVETSVLDLLDRIGVAHELAPARAGEILRSSLDSSRLRQAGWTPRVLLADGLRMTEEHLR